MSTREQRIQTIAYHLWEQEGRPDGNSERLWLAAEAQYEADLARERYEAELAKAGTRTDGRKAGSAEKPKPEEPSPRPTGLPAVKPAGGARAKPPALKVDPPAPWKKAPVGTAKGADPANEKPPTAPKRKPKGG